MALFSKTRAAVVCAINYGKGTQQLPQRIISDIKQLDEDCFKLVSKSVRVDIALLTEPASIYKKFSNAVKNGKIFRSLRPGGDQREGLLSASTAALNHTLSASPALHRLLCDTGPYLLAEFQTTAAAIPKLAHFWLLVASALREGESIVKEMKDVDAVMAQLLYHYVEKQRLATDKSIEYVSVLQPDTGEWHVHAFLKTPFEADYAAAFERSIQPIDLFHEDVSLANLLSPRHQYRNMFARSKLQRRLDESLVYWFETFFSCLVCLAFRIFAVLEWLRGLVVVSPLFLNFRTAKEMFLATLANYKSWRKRNPLLDNRRYRGVGPVESGTLIAHLTHEESTRAIMGGYDRQGMLLYLRCVVPVDGARLVTRVEWQRFYGDIAAQYHLIGPQLKEVLMRIACIKYTSDGATVSAPAMVLIYAWLYVLGGIVFSVLVGVYNWGNRDNALERVSDVVWVATTLLIAVFGIVKLTSEDPRSIRHALSGQMALMSARHVYEFLQIPLLDEGLTWEDALKGVAAVSPGKLEWLGEYETNFCEGDRIGDIRLPGGLPVRSLPAIVGLPGINGFVNVVLRKYRKTEENTGTDWLYVREEVAQVEVDIAANALKIG